MEEYKSKVYALCDEHNSILRIDGGYTMQNIENIDEWTFVDEGEGDRYNLCQSHYLEKSLYDERGICRYKWNGTEIIERTQEEMDADYVEPTPIPTQLDIVEAQTMYTALMTDTLLEE